MNCWLLGFERTWVRLRECWLIWTIRKIKLKLEVEIGLEALNWNLLSLWVEMVIDDDMRFATSSYQLWIIHSLIRISLMYSFPLFYHIQNHTLYRFLSWCVCIYIFLFIYFSCFTISTNVVLDLRLPFFCSLYVNQLTLSYSFVTRSPLHMIKPSHLKWFSLVFKQISFVSNPILYFHTICMAKKTIAPM